MEKITNPDLKRRIIDISYRHGLSHLGSCLSAVDVIREIYDKRKDNEPFVLSEGHAGLALYTVLEAEGGRDAEEIFNHHGVHPDRCCACGLDASTGSLGQGLPIAVGMALAQRDRYVWCLISDGEAAEGSIWEALRIADKYCPTNLQIYVNMNGYGAYDKVLTYHLGRQLKAFFPLIQIRHTTVNQLPFLKELDAHYRVLNAEEYRQAMEILNGKT